MYISLISHEEGTSGVTWNIQSDTETSRYIILYQDFPTPLFQAAKLANYAKYQRLCDFLFVLFAVVFFITRLVIYPLWILNTTLFESWEIIGPYPSWWLFNSLLLVLQVLHVIWSYLIAGIAYKALVRGKRWLFSFLYGVRGILLSFHLSFSAVFLLHYSFPCLPCLSDD
uniref:TLC domain-containing protein n=1 Tax=Hucho hucho TaxID=62062 RepID=A0A4W5RSB0_9TELE